VIVILLLAAVIFLQGCGGGHGDTAEAALPKPPPPPVPGAQPFGPPWLTGQDQNGVGWTGCVDYEAPRDGSGCFIQFLSASKSGARVSGITLNGGIWDATAGREQGDLDIGIVVDGQPGHIIAFTNLGIGVSHPNWASIGSSGQEFKELWLTIVPCPSSAPTRECVRVNGGYVPIYH
jgi:hypothetical protein